MATAGLVKAPTILADQPTAVAAVVAATAVLPPKTSESVSAGATWQRCRVHFTRKVLAYVSQKDKGRVAATVRLIFAQSDQTAAKRQAVDAALAQNAALLRAKAAKTTTLYRSPT